MTSSSIIIRTPRLLMRRFLVEDACDMLELNSDPGVIKHTGDLPFLSLGEALAFIKDYKGYETTGYGRMTLLSKKSGDYLGWCGLSLDIDTGETDIGFRLLQAQWGQGYATEAARACLQHGFDEFALKKIIGRAMEENIASIRVLKKLGMKFEKEFEAHGGRCVQYSISKQ